MKQHYIIVCLFIIVYTVSFTTIKAQVNKNDSLALVDLYNSTRGANWYNKTNWLTTASVSTWYGVTVTGTRATAIVLQLNNLQGVLPSIGNLDSLNYLDLSYNGNALSSTGVTGNLPSSIGNLTHLQHLDLTYNSVNGSLPSTIGNLTNLQDFLMGVNHLNGSIPSSIGSLKNLVILNLTYNLLTGEIPSSIGSLTNLQELHLDLNRLTGSIPASIGQLKHVTLINFTLDSLRGSIPSSIGNLTNLQDFEVYGNEFIGDVPTSLGNCKKLQDLVLTANKFTGNISFIGNLTHLTLLGLTNNRFTGPIPSSIGNLTELRDLTLDHNQLTGSIPNSISNLFKLQYLLLNANQLTGKIPDSIGNMIHLHELHLDSNQLSGGLPASFSRFKNGHIWYINLSHNHLSESVNVNYPNVEEKLTFTTDISYNDFNFNGLEFVAQKVYEAIYSPQAPVSIHQSNNVLSVHAGGTLSNDTFVWFKVGATDSTIINGDSTFHPSQNGMYYAHIINAIATQLTLTTDTVSYTRYAVAQNNIGDKMQAKDVMNALSVYPNPVKDIVHIHTSMAGLIALINSAGKIMIVQKITSTDEINVSTFSNGFYYIQNVATGEQKK